MRTANVACALSFMLVVSAAWGDALVSGVSDDAIEITSNYTGSRIAVFGAIERPKRNAPHDLVVVVRGPRTNLTVRRKDRIAGIWINRDQAEFVGVPEFYYVASSRPLNQIAPVALRAKLGVGLDVLSGTSVASHHDVQPFHDALVRRERIAGRYAEIPNGVQYLKGTLFRVQVPVPANVARGTYTAQVLLFRNGKVVGANSSRFTIANYGLERQLFNLAHRRPLAYGASAVCFAVLLGWLSSLFFRQSL